MTACRFFFHPDLPCGDTAEVPSTCAAATPSRITVGAVISTAHAFRLADFTADRDFHPALKICGHKGK